jgi:hypothetical protein
MNIRDPRQFFNEFVLPTVEEWRSEPLNIRKAVIAISQIDIMADQVVIYQNPTLDGRQLRELQAKDRAKAQQNEPLRLLVCDIHDAHKHGPLGRKSATITRGQRPRKKHIGGAFDLAIFQNDAFQVGRPVLEIVRDDSSSELVEDVVNSAVAYWEAELKKLDF